MDPSFISLILCDLLGLLVEARTLEKVLLKEHALMVTKNGRTEIRKYKNDMGIERKRGVMED